MLSQYSRIGESAEDFFVERTTLDGLCLAGVIYGILITLGLQCIWSLWECRKRRKGSILLLIYTIVVLILGTLGYAGKVKFVEMSYIDFRDYPGGPNAFTVDFYSNWVNMMSFASCSVLSWVADGLVLYRFIMLFNINYWIIPFPALIYLVMVGSSVALPVMIRKIGFRNMTAINIGVAYGSLSVSLHIIITILICRRLLTARNRVKLMLGPEHSKTYVSVMAMLVESATLYSVWGLLFIVLCARNSAIQNIFLPSPGGVEGIASLLIILRVARGHAWTKDTVLTVNGPLFNESGTSHSPSGVEP